MRKREFQAQIIQTESQWRSGLFQRLDFGANAISPFALPAFTSWVTNTAPFDKFGGLVSNACGQLLWTARTDSTTGDIWHVYRYDPELDQVETVIVLGSHRKIHPTKLWSTQHYLWIFDHRQGRILGLSSENFQILSEITIVNDEGGTGKVELIDLDFDQQFSFYALIRRWGEYYCYRYGIPGEGPVNSKCFPLENCEKPSALAIVPNGHVYVVDSGRGSLVQYSVDDRSGGGKTLKEYASDILRYAVSPVIIDSRGVIFLRSSGASDEDKNASGDSKQLHAYASDGSYLDIIKPPPDEKTAPRGFALDRHDNLYWVTGQRIAKFEMGLTPLGHNGTYYSRTLDNGALDGQWHRLSLQGQLPLRTSITVSYFTSNDDGFKAFIDGAIDTIGPVSERAKKIESVLGSKWKMEVFAGAGEESSQKGEDHERTPLEMLFIHNKGRYLCLKLELSTFDENQKPALSSLKIYYPRLSYLRYLPAIYREDEVSAAFVERFLSLFETVFHGLEGEIEQLFRYFDPQLTPAEFLPWLASWMNLSIGEDLPKDRARALLRQAPDLFRRRGTARGLADFLQAYTGRPAYVVAPSQNLPAILLGRSMPLGVSTVVLGAPLRAIRLGDSSVVGRMALRERNDGDSPEEPFLSLTRRFVIVLDMDRAQFRRDQARLMRIIDEQKPAHTAYTVRLVADETSVGSARVGVNATVTDIDPYRVGVTPLGRAAPLAKGSPGPRVERGAWLGGRSKLR